MAERVAKARLHTPRPTKKARGAMIKGTLADQPLPLRG
jgi:hypothetical protein